MTERGRDSRGRGGEAVDGQENGLTGIAVLRDWTCGKRDTVQHREMRRGGCVGGVSRDIYDGTPDYSEPSPSLAGSGPPNHDDHVLGTWGAGERDGTPFET